MIRRITAGAAGLVGLFHVWLLGSQLWDGQLAEPELILRWSIAAGLVAALIGLRRRDASMFRGRKAVSIWLLAALLHGPAMAGEHTAFESPALPEAITAVIQIAAASVMVWLGLARLAALAANPFAPPRVRLRPVPIRARGAHHSYQRSCFAPRPPPFRA